MSEDQGAAPFPPSQINPAAEARLKTLRDQIRTIDTSILFALTRRLFCARRIGEMKRYNNLPVVDLARETDYLEELQAISSRIATHELRPEFVERLYHLLRDEAVWQQSNDAEKARQERTSARRHRGHGRI